eukprot:1372368-Rhodomonas_salina.1
MRSSCWTSTPTTRTRARATSDSSTPAQPACSSPTPQVVSLPRFLLCDHAEHAQPSCGVLRKRGSDTAVLGPLGLGSEHLEEGSAWLGEG